MRSVRIALFSFGILVVASLASQGVAYAKKQRPAQESTLPAPLLTAMGHIGVFAERLTHSTDRYQQPVFAEVERTTMAYAKKEAQTLRLDFYQPQGDTLTARPIILYVHGGGFAGGTRDEERYVQFAQRMAKRGYTVASISYRLTMRGKSFGCDQPAANKIRTFQLAVEDIRSATKFLLSRHDELRIHTGQIILAGSSAGAEAVLHAAYWKNKDLLAGSPVLPATFRYAGVISMAGALVDLTLINQESAMPTLLYHGTCDGLVPFGAAPHHYCAPEDTGYLPLFGANAIARRLHQLDRSYVLVADCGGRHEWNDKPLLRYYDQMSRAIYRLMLLRKKEQQTLIPEQTKTCTVSNYFNCEDIWQPK